jgi:hypothetical protein
MASCKCAFLDLAASKICTPVHDALLASTPCEELHVVRNVDDMHKFAFIRKKKATKQKNNKHVPMATTSKGRQNTLSKGNKHK